MSLINDALKKAQRQSSQPPFGSTPPIPGEGGSGGGGHVRKRAAPMAAQTMVMIAAGCVVLIVISVVATVFLVNRPSKPAATTIAATKTPATPDAPISATKIDAEKGESPITPIVISAPILPPIDKRATETAAVTPTPVVAAPPASKPANTTNPSTTKVAAPVPAPRPATTASATPATPPASESSSSAKPFVALPVEAPPVPAAATAADHTESIHAFLDAIRLKGVRATGADSRVLMNEHVYRLNDLVDRSLGLRLTKVETGKLTFTDAKGVNYEKTY